MVSDGRPQGAQRAWGAKPRDLVDVLVRPKGACWWGVKAVTYRASTELLSLAVLEYCGSRAVRDQVAGVTGDEVRGGEGMTR